jgi:Carboxypeptidase regulatory-like domain
MTLLLLVAPKAAVGICDRPQPRLVRAEYSQSNAVVIAHLVKSQHIDPKDDQDYHLYTFQVEETLRGSIPSQFVLWDENSSARLTFDVLRGRKYLLFVNRWAKKNWWTADGCGNSGEVSKSSKALNEIHRLASVPDALITGNVETDRSVAHARVLASSKKDGKQFKTQTRDNGTFTLTVPPGEYSVKVTAGGKSFVTHWLSYENADSVKLERGGCAQIQFVPSDSGDTRSPLQGQ